MARDLGGVAVGERGGLERAAGLVEGTAQRADRRAPAGGGSHLAVRARERRAQRARDLDRLARPPIDHRTEERPPRGGAGRDQRRDARVGKLQLHCLLAGVRVLELEHEHRGLGADPERPQPAAQLVGVEPAPERLRQQVAGQASLGFAHHPFAHQLEPHDDRALPGGEALEVAQRAPLADDDQPGDGGAAAPSRHRNRQRTPGQRRVLGLERGQGRRRPSRGDLGPKRLQGRGAGAALAGVAGELAAGGVVNDRRAADRGCDRAEDRLQPASLDHQPLQPLVHLGAALQHRVLLVDQGREGALGDRDERHLVGDLEQRHAPLVGLVHERLGQCACARTRCRAPARPPRARRAGPRSGAAAPRR